MSHHNLHWTDIEDAVQNKEFEYKTSAIVQKVQKNKRFFNHQIVDELFQNKSFVDITGPYKYV